MKSDRRKFIKRSFASIAGMTATAMLPADLFGRGLHDTLRPKEIVLRPRKPAGPKESIRFGVIGLNHGHIYGMVDALIQGGGIMVAVFAKEQDLLADFIKRYPKVKVAKSEDEIIGDSAIQLVASAGIPIERARLGIRVMQAGKDYMTDKPGILTFEQFEEVKKVQRQTDRIYSIMYSERLGNPASVKAGELIASGAIGKVVQTIGLGPHRMRPDTRPEWFFDPEKAGGILCDIGSHQCDQFLFYTNSKKAEVSMSQIGNFRTTKYPNYGDLAI